MNKDQTTLDLFEEEKVEDYETMSLNTDNLTSDFDFDFLSSVDDVEVTEEEVVVENDTTDVLEETVEEIAELEEEINEIEEVEENSEIDAVINGESFDQTYEVDNMDQAVEAMTETVEIASQGEEFGEEYGKVNIMAIGIGGAGCNAINRMYDGDFGKIKLVAMDTSKQTLDVINADEKILLGESTLEGHGSGNDVEKATEAILEQKDKIKELLKGVDMVFVTAGIGRGTGSAGIVEIGKMAKEMGILTIGFAILPGKIEADLDVIEKYYNSFVDAVDANIVIENDKVNKVAADLPIGQARQIADQMLVEGIKGISDLITNPGKINLDYADIRTAFQNQGSCVMGIGYGENENSVVKAIEDSINEEVIDPESMSSAQTIIFNITCAKNSVTIEEAAEGTKIIYDKNTVHNIKHMLFGYSYDESLEDKVKVTFIATGTKPIDFENYKKETNGALSFGSFGGGRANVSKDIFSSVGTSDNKTMKPDFFN